MKLFLISASFAAAAFSALAMPSIENVRIDVSPGAKRINVTYDLKNSAAIVTLEFLTNGVPVSAAKSAVATGDVFRRVSVGDGHAILWKPQDAWPGVDRLSLPGLQAELTAWALDNPPDFMVANLSDAATSDDVRWYASKDAIPGGLTENSVYWMDKIVFRRIHATECPFVKGTALNSLVSPVFPTNDFYMAVFETTWGQWKAITGSIGSSFNGGDQALRRPACSVSYNGLRGEGVLPSSEPASGSFIDAVRGRTGLALDLPGENDWEFACNAYCPYGFWGDGSRVEGSYVKDSATIPGRNRYNGGWEMIDNGDGTITTNSSPTASSSAGTAPIATHNPNLFGLYDMHGNVAEWCRDAYDGSTMVVKGGSWNDYSYACLSCQRSGVTPGSANYYYGFRLWVPIPASIADR